MSLKITYNYTYLHNMHWSIRGCSAYTQVLDPETQEVFFT